MKASSGNWVGNPLWFIWGCIFQTKSMELLSLTYDGTYLRSYLNGKTCGILELADTPLKDNADIGVGGSEDGSNLFKG